MAELTPKALVPYDSTTLSNVLKISYGVPIGCSGAGTAPSEESVHLVCQHRKEIVQLA